MAGLNFQTQTIINSNLDPDSMNLGKEVKLFENKENALRIKRDFVFAKDDERGKVLAIRKRAGYDAVACKATIDFSAIEEIKPTNEEPKKYCRLDIYLGVEGAEPYIYSTPWVQKGMPFWVEFTVTKANQNKIAEVVADMIKKNHLFLVDKDLLNVEAKGNELTLTGATEYQRFRNVEVRTFAVTDDYAELVAELNDETSIELVERGKNAFGTYSQIVKDLRLPTAANYQWTHVRQVETPIVGAVYNQYIIEYCAPSTNEGLGAVGARLESHTTHVFWVKNDEELIGEWEAALSAVGTIEDVDAESASKEETPKEEASELNA
jgi:hypothetical protein